VTDLITRFAAALDFRQTRGYAATTRSLGWQVIGEPGSYIYLRRLGPLGIAKVQRPRILNLDTLRQLRKEHHIFWTYIEPGLATKVIGEPPNKPWYVEPYAHSATALIDLTQSENKLFEHLDTATRTKIRRAQKDMTISSQKVSQASQDQIDEFLHLSQDWSKQRHVIGYGEKYLRLLLANFKNESTLISARHSEQTVAQLLLIKNGEVATAFCIFTSPLGYRLRAPLLLNWEAIRHSKSLAATVFDFLGVFDPRYPKMYKRWQGFTAMKMLFKPTVVTFPRSYLLLGW
jgi:lipid II:glycine glycyltransferase (peptidoglycan interpeptide bridge formation enzyme)